MSNIEADRRGFLAGTTLFGLSAAMAAVPSGASAAEVEAGRSDLEIKSSFVVSKEDVANFIKVPRVDDQEGIGYAYEMDEETVRKILPPPLEYAGNVVAGYITMIKSPSFGSPYMETCNWVPATYGDTLGYYNISLMLYGPGAQAGMIVGDQAAGIPKKFADNIEVVRTGKNARATIVRHGETIFDLEVLIDGEYNDPETGVAWKGDGTGLGEPSSSWSWYHRYDMLQQEDGTTTFSNVRLLGEWYTRVRTQYEMGKIVNLKVVSTADDPYGELAMVKPIGASWYRDSEGIMEYTKVFAELDAEETMPYLLANRFDRGLMGDKSIYLGF